MKKLILLALLLSANTVHASKDVPSTLTPYEEVDRYGTVKEDSIHTAIWDAFSYDSVFPIPVELLGDRYNQPVNDDWYYSGDQK